jgi:hypothetical protein
MKSSTVLLLIVAAATLTNVNASSSNASHHLRRILKENQQNGNKDKNNNDNKDKNNNNNNNDKPANNPEDPPAANPDGSTASDTTDGKTDTTVTLDGSSATATTSEGSSTTDTTAGASAETSAPASAPAFIPVPVATLAPVYIPKNCCEFSVMLSELDNACHNAVREGRVAFSHQAFESNDFSCEVPSKSIIALQYNLKIARINYLNFLTPALQNLYPGVSQNCFALHPSSFTFACESRYIDENTFKTKMALESSLNAIEDYLCCTTPQAPVLNDYMPNIAQSDKTKRWCGGTVAGATPRC